MRTNLALICLVGLIGCTDDKADDTAAGSGDTTDTSASGDDGSGDDGSGDTDSGDDGSGDDGSGDADSGDADSGDDGSGGDGSGGDTALSHDTDIQPIWDANCAGCHTGGGSSGNLALDDGYAALVGVESSVAGMSLVTAGDPSNSYVMHKLNGTYSDVGGSGGAMPPSGSLSSDDLGSIEAWITGGAAQ